MRQIGFIAGQGGEIVKYDPNLHAPKARPKALTRHQRATLYFKAVRYIEKLFREVGFTPITDLSHGMFTLELGGFVLDMTVKQVSSLKIAHVTSYPGYEYDPKKIQAKITPMSVGEPGEYVIQVGAVLPNLRTMKPTYVIIDKESAEPLKDAFLNALMSARDFIRHDPATLERIQQAMASRNVESDFERFREQDESDVKTLHSPGDRS